MTAFDNLGRIGSARVIIGANTSFCSKSADFFLLSEDVCEYPLDFNLFVGGYDYLLDCFIQMLSQSCIEVGKKLFSLGELGLCFSLVLLGLEQSFVVSFKLFFFCGQFVRLGGDLVFSFDEIITAMYLPVCSYASIMPKL